MPSYANLLSCRIIVSFSSPLPVDFSVLTPSHASCLCLDLIRILLPQLDDEPLMVSDLSLCLYPRITLHVVTWAVVFRRCSSDTIDLDSHQKINIMKLSMVHSQ